MARNYGYGPTKLRPAALYNECREKRIDAVVGGGDGGGSATFVEALNAWADEEGNEAYRSALNSVEAFFGSLDTEETFWGLFWSLYNFHKDTMDSWENLLVAFPSGAPFTVMTPHTRTTDPSQDYIDLNGWRIDLSIAGAGLIQGITAV